jgi:hypothetical protein
MRIGSVRGRVRFFSERPLRAGPWVSDIPIFRYRSPLDTRSSRPSTSTPSPPPIHPTPTALPSASRSAPLRPLRRLATSSSRHVLVTPRLASPRHQPPRPARAPAPPARLSARPARPPASSRHLTSPRLASPRIAHLTASALRPRAHAAPQPGQARPGTAAPCRLPRSPLARSHAGTGEIRRAGDRLVGVVVPCLRRLAVAVRCGALRLDPVEAWLGCGSWPVLPVCLGIHGKVRWGSGGYGQWRAARVLWLDLFVSIHVRSSFTLFVLHGVAFTLSIPHPLHPVPETSVEP